MPPVRIRSFVDGIALTALCLGETLAGLLGWRWTVGPFSALLVAGVALLVVRHLVWPSPSLPTLLASRIRAYFATEGSSAAWYLALLSRAVVIIVGIVAVSNVDARFGDRPRVSHHVISNLPMRSDAGWYLGIARRGYDWRPELYGHRSSIAFFPAYPLTMRIGGDVVTLPAKATGNPELFESGDVRVLWGGALASVLCFGFALHHVYRLARFEGAARNTAVRAIVLLTTYPFALFFGVPYSESLFLLACAATVLAWKSDRRWATVAWGVLAGLSRSNGWTITIALLLDRVLDRREHRQSPPWAYALGPLLGAVVYSAYVYFLTGFPLAWVAAQGGWGRNVEPWSFLVRRWNTVTLLGPIGWLTTDPVDVVTSLAAAFCIATACVLAVQRRWLYAALVAAYLLPAIVIDLPATGRMTAVAFPAFILLAEKIGSVTFVTTAAVFAIVQVSFACRFFLWMTPY